MFFRLCSRAPCTINLFCVIVLPIKLAYETNVQSLNFTKEAETGQEIFKTGAHGNGIGFTSISLSKAVATLIHASSSVLSPCSKGWTFEPKRHPVSEKAKTPAGRGVASFVRQRTQGTLACECFGA